MDLSACIEWQFAEDNDTPGDRVRAAKTASSPALIAAARAALDV